MQAASVRSAEVALTDGALVLQATPKVLHSLRRSACCQLARGRHTGKKWQPGLVSDRPFGGIWSEHKKRIDDTMREVHHQSRLHAVVVSKVH